MLLPPLKTSEDNLLNTSEITLFAAEDNFQQVVDLLARNRRNLKESGRLLGHIGQLLARYEGSGNTEPDTLHSMRRSLRLQTEIWVGDYLKRYALLQLYIQTDQDLRRVHAFLRVSQDAGNE